MLGHHLALIVIVRNTKPPVHTCIMCMLSNRALACAFPPLSVALVANRLQRVSF